MLHRSCSLIKSIKPQTTRRVDNSAFIMGIINGSSLRQLHSLMKAAVKFSNKSSSYKFSHQKLCFCQRRELCLTSYLLQDKHFIEELVKSNENHVFSGSSVKPRIQFLAEASGGGSGNKLPDTETEYVQNYVQKDQIQNEKLDDAHAKIPCEERVADEKNNNIASMSNNTEKASMDDVKVTDENANMFNMSEVKNQKVLAKESLSSQAAVQNIAQENPTVGDREKTDLKTQKGKSNILLEKAKNLLRKSSKSDNHIQTAKSDDAGAAEEKISAPFPPKKRPAVDFNRCSTERNFITPVRAMNDFLLKPSDLENLRKTKRRSPYENDPPITVYWRKDVEAKAIDIWGSKENLLKEILKRDIERRRYQQNIFNIKRRLRDYRREQGRETESLTEQHGLKSPSGRVILTAIAINGANCLLKFGAYLYSGSHSMFSEAVHSLTDTLNQLILAYGIHKSIQKADSDHPYGYTNMKYVSSLISGAGIFFIGCGLSLAYGYFSVLYPTPVESYYWPFLVLAGSFISEGATLMIAFNSLRRGAQANQMSVTEYILRGTDPSVNVILLEDTAAVLGVVVAGGFMALSTLYNSPILDAMGSALVGVLLGGVAVFIIKTNGLALVGRSIPHERLNKINSELESDVMVRGIHDVKGIDIGNSLVRYKAELDFDGAELTRAYLDKQDLNAMLEEVKKFNTIYELEEFMLKHGENIVDMLGGEIDRIELKLRKKHPEIRHCDLEIL